jgi:hypothetical protein
MTAVVLVYLGLLICCLGIVSVLKPPGFLKIRARRPGALLLIAGIALSISGFTLPAPDTRITTPTNRLDEFAPVYQFHEVHSIRVDAPADRVYDAIKQVSADEISLFRTLTWIRRLGRPAPPGILNAPGHQPLLSVATRTSFLLLAEEPNHEIVVGTAVLVPRERRPTKQPIADDFKSMRAPGFALASMNFVVQPEGANTCLVTTETRVYATDPDSTRTFARYWRVIYPGSALIRRMWLRAIKHRAEAAVSASSHGTHDRSGTM